MIRRTFFSLLVVAATTGQAPAPCTMRLQIINGTDSLLREIYVDPSGRSGYTTDRLSPTMLGPGQVFNLRSPQGGLYDVRVVAINNRAQELRQVDTCRIGRITVTPGGLQTAARQR